MATPTVTIADDIHPVKPDRRDSVDLGGVYNARSLSRSRRPGDRRRSASRSSQDGRGEDTGDVEEGDDAWLREDGRKKQVFKGTTLLW
jgi:KUP system potassium uptake protein